MSTEATCSCQTCSGHVTFPVEMAGQMVECPHCHFETRLFIPPPAAVPKTPPRLNTAKRNPVHVFFAVALAVAAITAAPFIWQARHDSIVKSIAHELPDLDRTYIPSKAPKVEQFAQSNLKPVVGAFGWKLGDQLPPRYRAEVRVSDYDYKASFDFFDATNWPPFNHFNLEITPDWRICSIHAHAVTDSRLSFSPDRDRLISILTENYGRRKRQMNYTSLSEGYTFGTEEQSAFLEATDCGTGSLFSLDLEYYDKGLKGIASAASAAAEARVEDSKKAALRRGL